MRAWQVEEIREKAETCEQKFEGLSLKSSGAACVCVC